jgi:hypothetical protein
MGILLKAASELASGVSRARYQQRYPQALWILEKVPENRPLTLTGRTAQVLPVNSGLGGGGPVMALSGHILLASMHWTNVQLWSCLS